MKKLTKGALAMVLAGAVTFSVTNALLVGQSTKRLAEENGDHKKADVINQAEKTVKDQIQTTNGKDVQTKLSYNTAAFQVALKNRNKSNMTIAAIQQNPEKLTKTTITNLAYKNETTTATPAVATIPVTSAKVPLTTTTPTTTGAKTTTTPATTGTKTTTTPTTTGAKTTTTPTTTGANTTTTTPTTTGANTTTTPTTTGTNTTTASTTTTNHGQQVSQVVKEKAVSHKDKKENNENKM